MAWGSLQGVRWHNAGLTGGGHATVTAEGPRIVPRGPLAATLGDGGSCRPSTPHARRAFPAHLGPGRLTTIVVFLQTE